VKSLLTDLKPPELAIDPVKNVYLGEIFEYCLGHSAILPTVLGAEESVTNVQFARLPSEAQRQRATSQDASRCNSQRGVLDEAGVRQESSCP
jgi:hypothetical protein